MLNPTVGDARPGNIVWFDTETWQIKLKGGATRHVLRLGHAVHYRRFAARGYVRQDALDFYDLDTFWDWLNRRARKKTTTYLVAHNIVFDLAVVHGFEESARRGWTLQSFYSKATTSIFRWRQGERRLTGVDNTNLFQGKLERWGKLFELPKLSVDFEHVSDDDLMVYCRRDVEIMVRSWMEWLNFLDAHQLGNFKATTASTAMSAWRHRFMRSKVHIHVDPEALRLERWAYHGGRTECFWTGERSDGPYYYLDVNNMYGYVLSRFMYPCGLWQTDPHPEPDRLLRKLERQAVIARVSVQTDEPVYPLHDGNYTIYPVGTFTTTLTTPELILAFERGWFRGVHAMAWYRQSDMFVDYIRYMHTLRSQYRHDGNDGYAQIAKMLMNALYGKFGQMGFQQKRIGDADPEEAWSNLVLDAQTGEVYRMIALAGGVYEERKAGESANSFPAIAAHVTAYARLYLYQLIRTASRRHVYYCDTDSLIVDQAGYDNLLHLVRDDELGYLKVEHVSQTLIVRAPKDYQMDERVRVKGVSASAVRLDEHTVEQDRWQHLGGQIQAGSTSDYVVSRVVKHLNRTIRSGVVAPDGWIAPYRLEEVAVPGAAPHERSAVER